MKQILISHETSKLAKEKGFDWECINHYQDFDTLEGNVPQLFMDDVKNSELEPTEYSAPEQSLLQRWLREEHELFVLVVIGVHEFSYTINKGKLAMIQKYSIFETMKFNGTYEEALEKGLEETLKLIK